MENLIRLKEAVEKLKELKKIEGNADIAAALGYRRPQSISDIMLGKVTLTTKFVKAFRKEYGISDEWWKTGKGEMLAGDVPKKTVGRTVKDTASIAPEQTEDDKQTVATMARANERQATANEQTALAFNKVLGMVENSTAKDVEATVRYLKEKVESSEQKLELLNKALAEQRLLLEKLVPKEPIEIMDKIVVTRQPRHSERKQQHEDK